MYLIDTDPGIDDAHAIAMATRRVPHDQLVFTSVAGNVGIDLVTRNAAWLLGEFAPSAPLYRGAAGPLVGAHIDAAHIHGADGLGGVPIDEAKLAPVQSTHAAVAIAQLAREHAGEMHIIALGPLTNLALALVLEPRLPELVASLTIMGGSPAQHGNASLNAEFNIYVDPYAAECVMARMQRMTLLTWDLSLRTRFTRTELDAMWQGSTREAAVLRRLSDSRFAADPGYALSADFGRADPLAMAVALEPALVADAAEHRMRVVHDGGLAHGVTVVDERDVLTDRSPVRIITDLHRDRLVDALTV